MAAVTVHCRTLRGAVHSGNVRRPAPDALMALIGLLATLRDADGETAIDGITGFEWDGAQFDEQDFRELAGVEPDQPWWDKARWPRGCSAKPVVNVTGPDAPPTQVRSMR